jgi:hypothetical protein
MRTGRDIVGETVFTELAFFHLATDQKEVSQL